MNRIARGIGANVYAQASTVATQLLSVPLLLTAWGPERYGTWLMLLTVAAYLGLFEFGFTGVAMNRMIMGIAAGKADMAMVSYQSAFVLILGVGVVLSAVAVPVGIGIAAPVAGWLGIDAADVLPAALMIVMQVIAQMLVVLLCGVYQAEQRYAQSTIWTNTARLIEFALVSAGAVWLKAGFMELLAVIALTRLGLVLAMYTHACQFAPWARVGLRHASLHDLREMLLPAIAMLAFPFGNALNLQGIVLLAGTLFGPVVVAHFSAMRTLARIPYQLSQLVNLALAPEIGRLYGEGKTLALRSLYRRSTAGCIALAVLSSGALYVLGDWICRFWTHGKLLPEHPDYEWLLLAAVVNSLWYTGSLMFTSTNNHTRYSLLYLGANAAGLLVAWLAGKSIGSSAVALGVLATEVVLFLALLPRIRVFVRSGMVVPKPASSVASTASSTAASDAAPHAAP
ncbi:Membrane protein involved in the export of O-antigen and teichoic acid [Ralstonia sp. 25mfcol4.1]|uniref:lipopolysaccharide biosynthesis protein n=1 Tax=Burkholderiaceae TaxID=119060 RepID=UPI0008845DED|nr:lipopolysaccharide biosynthesis protein [Ralstonia sp. 25mfcol4.1]SDP78447.1 Membrane protein involved in the export of O-antigen and teichoic acid [Ralstonia sp. 25mfcol4.1]